MTSELIVGVITVALATFGVIFQMGRVVQRVESLEEEMKRLGREIDRLNKIIGKILPMRSIHLQ